MTVERRTIAGWCHHLQAPDAELTLSEFMARCLLDLRENVLKERLATEAMENMLNIANDLLLESSSEYQRLAQARAHAAERALANGRADGLTMPRSDRG